MYCVVGIHLDLMTIVTHVVIRLVILLEYGHAWARSRLQWRVSVEVWNPAREHFSRKLIDTAINDLDLFPYLIWL